MPMAMERIRYGFLSEMSDHSNGDAARAILAGAQWPRLLMSTIPKFIAGLGAIPNKGDGVDCQFELRCSIVKSVYWQRFVASYE